MSFRRNLTVTALSVAAVVGGSVPASAAPTTTESIAWAACTGAPADYAGRCGQLAVPGASVRVARLPAAVPAKRIGVLMFNPGGPGASAADIVANPEWATYYFPQEILDRFDVVGVDGRGVGGTNPVTCTRPPADPETTRFPVTVSQTVKLVGKNLAFGMSCGTARRDTAVVADDMDAVRTALGEDKINFLALSYGTMVAQSYTERHGAHLRALVLDGVVDRSMSWQQLVDADTAAVEDGYQRFAQWCAAAQGCEQDAPALLAAADRGELKAGDRTVHAEEVASAINGGLNTPALFPGLADALKLATTGDASGLVQFSAAGAGDQYATYRSIICQDLPSVNPADLVKHVPVARRGGPTLRGASEFWDIASGCTGWPGSTHWKPHPWRPQAGSPAPLLVSGAHDVATPRVMAESVHKQLPGSTLVTWDGDGHTAWLNQAPQARAAILDYLVG